MNALTTIGILCIFAVQFVQGATVFTTLPNSEGVFSTVEITDDAARVVISTPSEFIGADIAVESLLGDPASLLVFQITDTPLATLPSPPFTLGGIDFPATPSRLVFEQDYAITEAQVAQFADLDSVTLQLSGGSLAEPVSLALSAVPEPSGLSMITLASATILFRRRRPSKRNQTGEQVGAQEAPKALRVL
jgi:hypothetical protein